MKKILVLSLFVAMNGFGAERILIDDNKQMEVDLNPSTVRCSAFGYGISELKITLKGLDGWTIFNHSNINAGDTNGEPCMTAGQCRDKRFPNLPGLGIIDILGINERTETIIVNRQIVEVKEVTKNEKGNDICSRHIEERLETSVNREDANGKIKFTHLRSGIFEIFPLSVCQK